MLAMITAVIKPQQLEAVKDALLANGVEGMTVSEVRGFGRQRGKTENFRGSEYTIDFVPKVKLEIIVHDDNVRQVVSTITEAAKTGRIGDGKIFVSPIERAVRIRTGETDADAL